MASERLALLRLDMEAELAAIERIFYRDDMGRFLSFLKSLEESRPER